MLTKKQEGFAQDVARGETQTDAYRANYNTKTDNDHVVTKNASILAKNGDVAVRIAEHEEKAFEGIDRQEWVLTQLKKQAVESQNEATKTRATELIGKTVGMFKDVVEDGESRMSMDELLSQAAGDDPRKIALLEELLGLDDEANTTH